MKNDWLNKHLKNELSDYEMDMDALSAWDRFEERRQKEDRFPIIWMFVLLLAVGLGSFGVFQLDKTTKATAANTINSHDELIPNQNKEIVSSQELKTETPTQTNNVTEIKQNSETIVTKKIAKNERELSKVNLKNPALKSTENTLGIYKNNNEISTTSFKQNQAVKFRMPRTITSSSSSSKSIIKNSSSKSSFGSPLNKAEGILFAEINHISDWKQILKSQKVPVYRNNQKSTKKNSISLTISSGASFASIKGSNSDQLAMLNENLTTKYMRSIGLQYRRKLTDYLFIETGINYQRWVDNISYNQEELVDITLQDQITEIIYYPDGSTQEIREDVVVKETNTTTYDVFNTSQYYSIPLLVGLQNSISSSLGIRGGIGIDYAITASTKGYTFDNNLQIVELNDDDYKTNNHLFGSGYLELYYHITDNLDASFGTNIKADLSSRTANSSDFDARYTSWGLRLGLSKRF